MASISEMILGKTGQDFAQSDVLSSVQKGAAVGLQLATLDEQVQQEKNKVEIQREVINTSKFNRVTGMIDRIVSEDRPTAQKNLIKVFKSQFTQLGLGDISDSTLDQLANDPEVRNNWLSLNKSGFFKLLAETEEGRNEVLKNLIDTFGLKEGLSKALTMVENKKKELAKGKREEVKGEERAAATGIKRGREIFKDISSLRKERKSDPTTASTRSLQEAFSKIKGAAEKKDPTGAGDLSLIFNFMKMLDPKSVVRESEFRTAEFTTGIPQRILEFKNKILEGTRLTPPQRINFLNESKNILREQIKRQESADVEFKRIAETNKFDTTQLGIRKEDTLEGIKDLLGDKEAPRLAAKAPGPKATLVDFLAQQEGVTLAQAKEAVKRREGRELTAQEIQLFQQAVPESVVSETEFDVEL